MVGKSAIFLATVLLSPGVPSDGTPICASFQVAAAVYGSAGATYGSAGATVQVPTAERQNVGSQTMQPPDTRTDKQKALARQTARLFDMATELKAQVDLTNKNILSLKVVEKAEEIETLAKGMRGQVKK